MTPTYLVLIGADHPFHNLILKLAGTLSALEKTYLYLLRLTKGEKLSLLRRDDQRCLPQSLGFYKWPLILWILFLTPVVNAWVKKNLYFLHTNKLIKCGGSAVPSYVMSLTHA